MSFFQYYTTTRDLFLSTFYPPDLRTNRDDLPRTHGVSGQLKSPRDLSQLVHHGPESKNEDSIWSMEFSLWGQFLSHDIADRAPIKGTIRF